MFRKWLIKKLVNRKEELLSDVVADLFNVVSIDDILRKTEEGYMFADRPLMDEEMDNLKAEANLLTEMKLWQVLKMDIDYHASRKTVLDSKTEQDITNAKLLIYFWNILETRINKLR